MDHNYKNMEELKSIMEDKQKELVFYNNVIQHTKLINIKDDYQEKINDIQTWIKQNSPKPFNEDTTGMTEHDILLSKLDFYSIPNLNINPLVASINKQEVANTIELLKEYYIKNPKENTIDFPNDNPIKIGGDFPKKIMIQSFDKIDNMEEAKENLEFYKKILSHTQDFNLKDKYKAKAEGLHSWIKENTPVVFNEDTTGMNYPDVLLTKIKFYSQLSLSFINTKHNDFYNEQLTDLRTSLGEYIDTIELNGDSTNLNTDTSVYLIKSLNNQFKEFNDIEDAQKQLTFYKKIMQVTQDFDTKDEYESHAKHALNWIKKNTLELFNEDTKGMSEHDILISKLEFYSKPTINSALNNEAQKYITEIRQSLNEFYDNQNTSQLNTKLNSDFDTSIIHKNRDTHLSNQNTESVRMANK